MKKLHLLKSMLLLFAMIVGSTNVWAQTAAVDDVLWTEPFTGTNTSTTFSETSSSSWGSYTNPTTFVAADKSSLVYSSSNVMLNSSSSTNLTGAHIWLKKNTSGVYFQVEGIQLYNSTKVTVSWAQTGAAKLTVAYAFDGGDEYTDLSSNSSASAKFESDELDVSGHTTINLKFHRTNTSTNIRIDNLTLTVTKIATPAGTTEAPTITGAEDFFSTRTVSITNAASADGAAIYYTLNGDDPTTTTSATCFAYTGSFEVSATTTVKAIAKHEDDTNASSVVSKTFTKQTPLTGLSELASMTNTTDEYYYVNLTNAQVTFASGTVGYIEDANAGCYIYGFGATRNKVYNGIFRIKHQKYNNLPEVKGITEAEGCTITDGAEWTPIVMDADDLSDDDTFTDNLARQILINDFVVPAGKSLTTGVNLYGTSPYTDVTVGKRYNLIGYPFINNTTKTFRVISAKELVPITITAAKWASFSSTNEVAIPTGVTAYYAKENDANSVTLKPITTGIIPANEGVVLYSSTSDTYYAEVSTAGESNISGNLLKPWAEDGVLASTYYILSVNGAGNPVFRKSSGSGTFAAGKAYLDLSTLGGAHELTITIDGETTDISAVLKQNVERTNDNIYNLAGQRVAQPAKGLYIVNGRKVIFK